MHSIIDLFCVILTINHKPVKEREPKRFLPPTQKEVFDYMKDRGVVEIQAHEEADKFVNYFESVGWIVGRTKKPMKSWKSWHL